MAYICLMVTRSACLDSMPIGGVIMVIAMMFR